MRIELHMLQNFAPSCLNRDDLNSPKDCQFGGVRRARISSQCQKRSIRFSEEFSNSIQSEIGKRTRYLGKALTDALVKSGKEQDEATRIGVAVAEAIGKGDKNGRTSVGLYLGADEIDRIAEAILSRYSELVNSLTAPPPKNGDSELQKLAKEVKDKFKPGTRAADIALYGRMIAASEHFNIDASCQVAHAISTHAVSPELDFFTAVDDLQPKSDPGAGMLGTQEFNSPCLYRYANLDLEQLSTNLGGDKELENEAVLAFIRAAVLAIPTAKQNSHAAQQLPDFVLCTLRELGPLMSLSNAFAKPVKAPQDISITAASAKSLADYWEKLNNAYGDISKAESSWYGLDIPDDLVVSAAEKKKGLTEILDWLREKLENGSNPTQLSEGNRA